VKRVAGISAVLLERPQLMDHVDRQTMVPSTSLAFAFLSLKQPQQGMAFRGNRAKSFCVKGVTGVR